MGTLTFSVTVFSMLGLLITIGLLAVAFIEDRPRHPLPLIAFVLPLGVAVFASAGFMVGLMVWAFQLLLGWA